jgi:hypothetical protein
MGTVLGEGGRKKLIALAHICPDPVRWCKLLPFIAWLGVEIRNLDAQTSIYFMCIFVNNYSDYYSIAEAQTITSKNQD